MGRRLQFLCVDGDSKARHSVLVTWSYLWAMTGGLGSSCCSPFHYLIIAIPLNWKEIDFRADYTVMSPYPSSVAYLSALK